MHQKRICEALDTVLEQYRESISLEAYGSLRAALVQAVCQLSREDCQALQQCLGVIMANHAGQTLVLEISDRFRAVVEDRLYCD